MKKEMNLEVGKKYRGWGYLNAYGEMCFTPEQKGVRAGKIKIIKETETYKLSTTQNLVQIYVKLPKQKSLEMCQALMQVMNELLTDLRTYEI